MEKRHVKKVPKIKIYKCPPCGREYPFKSYLLKHMPTCRKIKNQVFAEKLPFLGKEKRHVIVHSSNDNDTTDDPLQL
jgi:hypothetical protein